MGRRVLIVLDRALSSCSSLARAPLYRFALPGTFQRAPDTARDRDGGRDLAALAQRAGRSRGARQSSEA